MSFSGAVIDLRELPAYQDLPDWPYVERISAEDAADRISLTFDAAEGLLLKIDLCKLTRLRESQFDNGKRFISDLDWDGKEPIVVIQNRYGWAAHIDQSRGYTTFRIRCTLTHLRRHRSGTVAPSKVKFGQSPADMLVEMAYDGSILLMERALEKQKILESQDAVIITFNS